jgi:hypothetical protein
MLFSPRRVMKQLKNIILCVSAIPANNGFYNALTQISGSCNDTGYSGINTVNLTIFNGTSTKYWNGTGWDTPVTWNVTTLAANYSWWTYNTSSVTWTTAHNIQ